MNHAGLVTVLDAGTTSEQPYIVMELIDGPSLADCCDGTVLDILRVQAIGTQVADALAYAHGAGVVHRDVKPGNVMLPQDGRVLLTDFGIARLIGDTARHTGTGLTIGSPAYFSPEQVRGDEVTAATDLYSLGLVLLQSLTGCRVYRGTPTEAALARLSNPPVIPESLPPAWRRLLGSMTALEPTGRPTARQVAVTLREPSTGAAAPPITVTSSSDPGDPRVLPPPPREASGHGDEATFVLRRKTNPWRLPAGKGVRWVLGGVVPVLLVVVLVLLLSKVGAETEEDGAVPQGVPPRLEEPLRDLHDAVNGQGQ